MNHTGRNRNRGASTIVDMYLDNRELTRRVHNLVSVGTIAEIDYETARARVNIDGTHTTGFLKWVQPNSHVDIEWNPPAMGEQVLVLAVSGRLENGLIIKGLYTSDSRPTNLDGDTTQLKFSDNTLVRYNKVTKKLLFDINNSGTFESRVGNSTIVVDENKIVLTSGGVSATLDSSGLRVTNNIVSTNHVQDFNGTMQEMRTIFNSHTHPGDSGGTTGTTSTPMI